MVAVRKTSNNSFETETYNSGIWNMKPTGVESSQKSQDIWLLASVCVQHFGTLWNTLEHFGENILEHSDVWAELSIECCVYNDQTERRGWDPKDVISPSRERKSDCEC